MTAKHQWNPVVRRVAANYLCIQGVSGMLWWVLLLASPSSRHWFLPEQFAQDWIIPIAVADISLFAIGSCVAATICVRSSKLAGLACASVAGIASYAFLLILGASLYTNEGWLGTVLMVLSLCMSIACTILVSSERAISKLFRVSQVRADHQILARTLLQSALFWLTLLVLLPAGLHALERNARIPTFQTPPLLRVASVFIFIMGGSLGLMSGYIMARIGKGTPIPLESARLLVIEGPYKHVRNPMAIGGLTQGAAVALWLGSPVATIYVLLGGIVWNFFLRPLEEHDLQCRFSTEYQAYKKHVRCWIPIVPGYECSSKQITT
ncbi:MAG: isoprenylcysteine carboxylmethyltransferase family protein [Phycisphaeraceae bacterium]|nr:isoprenylcysteine carboxylmethyltransferase family protein [Phycisphaerales bacterium]MCB9858918.1 isoprenylcysteine carboxylmethyltransferase family protein [Phycisphaeraceae bacterium]